MRPFLLALALAALLASLLVACLAPVDYSGTSYQCPDGVTCPDGFRCVAEVCREGASLPPEADADLLAPDADPLAPDAHPRPDANPLSPDAAPPSGGPMVPVAAGSFLRGCDPAGSHCLEGTTPQRSITLSAFSIDQHEVTQGEYQECVAAGACRMPASHYDPVARASFPVVEVTWADAVAYCASVQKRLPTEAEWEKAARGSDGRTYPWGETRPDCPRASFDQCTAAPVQVGSHSGDASPYLATEMAGNVAEWVADYYSKTYYGSEPDHDPPGPTSGDKRVVRGGDYESVLEFLRTFDRDLAAPGATEDYLGFRCAR
jgi:formylglycine-generating enzyme required for sulfatase activity